jgi:hypothetical protein
MIRNINIEATLAGAPFSMWVQYDHDPGQPWTYDCGPLGESVEIVDMGIVSKSGDGELRLNEDQFNAVLETCREAIEETCLEDAAEVLRCEGWEYDSHYRAWSRPRMRRTA